MRPCRRPYILAIALLIGFTLSCASRTPRVKKEVLSPEVLSSMDTLNGKKPVLKLHMVDGGLYVLDHWDVVGEGKDHTVRGQGVAWDLLREHPRRGEHEVPVDQIVVVETNVVRPHYALASLAILSAASAGLAVYCHTVDKACFGSCPTFYVEQDGERWLAAEGFSHAIAPFLEATDVDALTGWRPRERDVSISMTNEAMETHVIRWVRLLALPRNGHDDVFQFDDAYRPGTVVGQMKSCQAEEGDCLADLEAIDGRERTRGADAEDLARKETLTMQFTGVSSEHPLGLVARFRHSFMTTFLIYQWLAYLGSRVGETFAALERGLPIDPDRGIAAVLGKLEFEVQTASGWTPVGQVGETGPLALETKALLLPESAVVDGRVTLRLRGTRGYWRVDGIQLVELGDPVTPVAIEATSATREGVDDPEALARFHSDSDEQNVTFRGDAYELGFELPEAPHTFAYFLQSRGYYLEWMRDDWLDEENREMALLMMVAPRRALRLLAPKFKAVEPRMEEIFWKSRYRPREVR